MNARVALAEMLPWLAALLGLALLGGFIVFLLKKHYLADDHDDAQRGILEHLRRLRDRGEISEDEYETARLKIVARLTGKDFEQLRDDAIRKAGGRVADPGRDLLGRPLPTPNDTPGPDTTPPTRN